MVVRDTAVDVGSGLIAEDHGTDDDFRFGSKAAVNDGARSVGS